MRGVQPPKGVAGSSRSQITFSLIQIRVDTKGLLTLSNIRRSSAATAAAEACKHSGDYGKAAQQHKGQPQVGQHAPLASRKIFRRGIKLGGTDGG